MFIIGCDLHTRYQVVAWVDEETGKIRTRRLEHGKEEVQAFYVGWPRGARIGIEATFPALWFERLLAECGHELWVGDAAQIRAKAVRQQKTDPALRDRAPARSAADESLSAHLGAAGGGARPAPVVGASHEVGAGTDAGEESTARSGDEPGSVSEAQAVERKRTSRASEPSIIAMGKPATPRTAGLARSTGSRHRSAGPRGSGRSGGAGGGEVADDPPGSGAGGESSLRADGGAGGTLCPQRQAGELPG